MPQLVVDYAWSHPDAAAIKASGYIGVMRYLSRDASKSLSLPEIATLKAQGLGVGLVFEDSAQRALGGSAAGSADGQFANAQADALGYPRNLPIFYAVDFSVSASQLPVVLAYLQAAGSTGRPAHGYGSIDLVHYLEAAGIPDNWQTCAWSAGQVDGKAALYQRLRPTTNLQGSFDEDVVLDPAFTLWFPGAQPANVTPPTKPSYTSGKNGPDMLIIQGSGPEQRLVLGDGSVHIPTPADIVLLEGAGVPSVHGISDQLFNSIAALS